MGRKGQFEGGIVVVAAVVGCFSTFWEERNGSGVMEFFFSKLTNTNMPTLPRIRLIPPDAGSINIHAARLHGSVDAYTGGEVSVREADGEYTPEAIYHIVMLILGGILNLVGRCSVSCQMVDKRRILADRKSRQVGRWQIYEKFH